MARKQPAQTKKQTKKHTQTQEALRQEGRSENKDKDLPEDTTHMTLATPEQFDLKTQEATHQKDEQEVNKQIKTTPIDAGKTQYYTIQKICFAHGAMKQPGDHVLFNSEDAQLYKKAGFIQ